MANSNNLNLLRGGSTIFWKNNIFYTFFYSKLFFQLILIKKIIKIFLLNFFFFTKQKKKTYIYLSQIWLNSLNSSIFISLNFSYQIIHLSISSNVIYENYLRLKYFYYLSIKKRHF